MNLICGINPVLEAISAGTRHFDRLLVVKGLRNRRISEAMARASQLGIPLRFEARETLDRMAGGVPHQGLIAVVSAKPVIGVEELLKQARDPALVVVLDGVEDPRNLGAILRSVEAAGSDGVLLPERHSAGLSESVSRASAGALDHVRVARIGNVVQALDTLKARGFWVVGFDAAGTERWDQVDYRRPIALVLGGEGRGIRRLVRERCDHLASIPLFGHVGSLNVSVAAAIALYEVVRQRGATPSHVRPIPAKPASVHRAILGPGAGDQEDDPGRIVTGLGADEPDDAADGATPLFVEVDAEEPVAWAGPTVLKAVAHRGRHGGERFHASRGLHGGRRSGRRPPRESQASEEGTTSAPPPGPKEPGRGRRRRRGRRPPPPAGSSPSGSATPAAGEPESGRGSAPSGQPGQPPRRGRRRRRRR
jgi:23S rRNA (guanosine2251-2'-O)-methyltransferase